MGFSLFEREGGPVAEGNHQRGCGPRLPVSEILCTGTRHAACLKTIIVLIDLHLRS